MAEKNKKRRGLPCVMWTAGGRVHFKAGKVRTKKGYASLEAAAKAAKRALAGKDPEPARSAWAAKCVDAALNKLVAAAVKKANTGPDALDLLLEGS